MRFILGLMAAVSIGPLAQAVAMDQPPAPQSTVEPAGTIPAPEATQASAATAPEAEGARTPPAHTDGAAKISLVAGDEDAAAQLKRLKAAGYTPEVHGSEIWFCRKETIIGSRFEKKICNTVDQLAHIAASAQQQTVRIQSRISGDPKTKNHP